MTYPSAGTSKQVCQVGNSYGIDKHVIYAFTQVVNHDVNMCHI